MSGNAAGAITILLDTEGQHSDLSGLQGLEAPHHRVGAWGGVLAWAGWRGCSAGGAKRLQGLVVSSPWGVGMQGGSATTR